MIKSFLFDATAAIGFWTMTAISWVLDALLPQLLHYVSFAVRSLITNLCRGLMYLIDKEQYEAIKEEHKVQATSEELQILSSLSKIKDHAIKTGDWTDKHTQALEALGNALLENHNWEEESIHQYLREIVESIPGLQYGVQEGDPRNFLSDED